MRSIRRYARNGRGQAIVELALILPIFLLLVVGMMEFGLVMHDYITVAEAARAGARAAAVRKDDATVIIAAKNAAPSIPLEDRHITITPASRTAGSAVTVQVVYPVPVSVSSITNPWSGEVYDILPATFNVTGTAVMRVE